MRLADQEQRQPSFINLCEVIANKLILRSTPFVYYHDRGGFYIVNGKEIPHEEFEAMYPTKLISTSILLDGRTNFY